MICWPRWMEGIPEEECFNDDEMIIGEGKARVERATAMVAFKAVVCVCVIKTFTKV